MVNQHKTLFRGLLDQGRCMGVVTTLLGQVQTSVTTAVQDASLASETATAAISTLTTSATPNAGGPLDEVARHVQNNSQTVLGMRSEVNQLVSDLLPLTQDFHNHLPPAGGMGGSFIGGPFTSIPAPQPPSSQ